MSDAAFEDLKAQLIDAITNRRSQGAAILWEMAERHCNDEQLRILQDACALARWEMLTRDGEAAAR